MRVPVYFRTNQIELTGLSFAVGLASESLPLRMIAGEAGAPTLEDRGIAGTLAVAWLNGLKGPGERRLLLGYVLIPSGDATVASSLRLFGVQIN